MPSKIQKFCALLAFVIASAYAYAPARPYVAAIAGVLGALSLIGTSLAILPGRAGAFFAALGKDVDAMRAAISPRPTGPSGPSVVIRAAGALMLALSVVAVGCAAAIPAIVVAVTDGACVLSHFDELEAAERVSLDAFIAIAARVAKSCGITVQQVVGAYGTEKASRAARAAKGDAASACSSTAPSLASPVRP